MHFGLSRKIRIIIVATAALFLFMGWESRPTTVNRAAIDVGSGSIKVTVAAINPQTNQIRSTLYSQEHPVPFKRDIQVGGNSQLSESIQATALNTLANLKEQLAPYQAKEWKGVATAASRQATNAQDMYDKIHSELGMDISIISQEEEGRLGFETAAAVSKVDPNALIAVDSGSGSFQLATRIDGELEVIEGDLGYIPSLEILMDIRNEALDLDTPPKPVQPQEVPLLIDKLLAKMPPKTESFSQKMKDPTTKVVGIGNENFIFAMGATGVGKDTFTKEELLNAIHAHAGLEEENMKQFAKPNTAVLGMVLLYSIMDAMEIDTLTASRANGVCEGLLVDANYWSMQTAHTG